MIINQGVTIRICYSHFHFIVITILEKVVFIEFIPHRL